MVSVIVCIRTVITNSAVSRPNLEVVLREVSDNLAAVFRTVDYEWTFAFTSMGPVDSRR